MTLGHYSQMPMLESPAFLALTWLLWWVASVGFGWLTSRRKIRNPAILGWFGLLAVTVTSLILGLILPLGAPLARIGAWVVLAIGLIGFACAGLWRRWRLLLVVAAIAVIAALLSSVVPSNYDLGLYHAGSIAYVRDGGTVIGLANLHDRFGFSSSMWPLSALLGLGLWDGGEFRLVNGLLLALLTADVLVRIRSGRSRQPGTVVLTAGAVLLVGAVIQYPGRLIASSGQDWSLAVLMVVSAAYLVDALTPPRRGHVVTVAIVIAALAGAMRPTGWIYAVATVAVIAWFHARTSGWRVAWCVVSPGIVIVLVLGALTAVRDALTSGWLLFPAGVAPLPVPWRYPDPSETSQGVTAWARTPFQDLAQTLEDNSWITGWLFRLPTDWAFFAMLILLLILIAWLVFSRMARRALVTRSHIILLSAIPSWFVLIVWVLVAPDPRFAWGPLLLVVLIPMGFLVPTISRPRVWPAAVALASIAIVAVAVFRGSVLDISLRLQPMPAVAAESSSLADGTSVVIPVNGDQCWGEFPLCRPWYSSADVELRGETWQSGFQPISRLNESQE